MRYLNTSYMSARGLARLYYRLFIFLSQLPFSFNNVIILKTVSIKHKILKTELSVHSIKHLFTY